MSAMHVEHISVFINRRPAEVYAFASDPGNLPRWAAGLARSEVSQEGDEWVADSPMGKVRIRFVPENAYGVLDHDVTLESGVTVHNPMRVVPNGDGSEFIFTLFRQPEMSDEKFAEDRAAVEKDLRTLKELLENKPPEQHEAPVTDDERAIRELVATWMSASQAADVKTLAVLRPKGKSDRVDYADRSDDGNDAVEVDLESEPNPHQPTCSSSLDASM